MIKPLLLLLLALASCLCHAQDLKSRDSLLQLIKVAKEDSVKVNLYMALGNQYAPIDLKTAVEHYRQAGDLSKRIGYSTGISRYYAYYSNILSRQGLFDSALVADLEAVEWARKLHDSLSLGKAMFNTGIAYWALDEQENAVKYIEISRDIFARIGNTQFEGNTDDVLQSLARVMHQYRKGVEYGLRAVEKLEKYDLKGTLSYTYNNLGLNYIELKMYDSAKYYLKKSMNGVNVDADATVEVLGNMNLGYIAFLQDDFEGMKPYVEKALALAQKNEMHEYEGLCLWGVANYYLHKKEYAVAKMYADSVLNIAHRYNIKSVRLKVLPILSSIAYAMQDVKKGLYYVNQYQALNDSVLNESVTKTTIQVEKKYETGKKEDKIKLQQQQLRQQSILNYCLIAGATALLVISLMGYRNYRNRQKLQQVRIDELETEKKLTATEAVLKGEEQERTRLAKDLHDGLGGMLSGIKFSLNNMKANMVMTPDNAQAFERSIDMLDSSISEMRRVAHNMMPEVLVRYGLDMALKEFCHDIDRSGVIHVNYLAIGMNDMSFEQTTAVTIYRIVQELVNNTIKHAAAKNIFVQVHASGPEKLLAITVEDDGKGFDTSLLENARGIGWANIKNRVEFLKGTLDIQSEPGKGTSVMIEIGI
ncbi:MAG: sensor histidine kinase [Chitinophagaceae bacterium]